MVGADYNLFDDYKKQLFQRPAETFIFPMEERRWSLSKRRKTKRMIEQKISAAFHLPPLPREEEGDN